MKALLHVARKYKEECDKITEDIRKRVRGKNSRLFISMHKSHSEPQSDEEVAWGSSKVF